MSGEGTIAAIGRVFLARQREGLDGERAAPLADLAARVRELTEAVVLTDVDSAEVAAVSVEVAALTARLNAVRRAHPPVARFGPEGVGRPLANPVTGALNPIAPPVETSVDESGTVHGSFTLSPVYEGPPGFVHGGVAAMILDQLLGIAASVNGRPGMTATLDMRYRRPTLYGVPLTAQARVVRVEGRKTFCEAQIFAPDGKVTAEADAMFILPTS